MSEQHIALRGNAMRAIVCNAGCANACTGERGERDARATARQAAALLNVDQTEIVVASTGVIGVYLPMDRMHRGLERAVKDLEEGMEAAYDAAEAIMTTDNEPKLAAYAFYCGKQRYVVGGIAKGSGHDRARHGDDARLHRDERADVARGLARRTARSDRRELQYDFRRRRHVDQRLVLRVRAAGRRRRARGLSARRSAR